MTHKDYKKMTDDRVKRSPTLLNCIKAFLTGGFICVLGQALTLLYQEIGASVESSKTLSTVSLVVLAGLLTGIGVFDVIAKQAGAGTLVPITGFSNAVTAPAIENKTEGFINGVGAKMFVIAGPVIVYGTFASAVYGVVYYFLLKGGLAG